MTTNIEGLIVFDRTQKRQYSAQQIIDVLDTGGAPGASFDATYSTTSVSPTVYYTALATDGSVITARTTSGVTLNGANIYVYHQVLSGQSEFVAVWDEGDANDFVSEQVVL